MNYLFLFFFPFWILVSEPKVRIQGGIFQQTVYMEIMKSYIQMT